jgi:hypothetical protein
MLMAGEWAAFLLRCGKPWGDCVITLHHENLLASASTPHNYAILALLGSKIAKQH